ncbi:hypothetical protein XENOCAPTIV_003992 [Xenoophorus captivus]|uniref:Uncharacterized protein n=1 Tax=Xenoophorus captivus TaxID=1517983 RepID=A0ABV0QH24_9TELE
MEISAQLCLASMNTVASSSRIFQLEGCTLTFLTDDINPFHARYDDRSTQKNCHLVKFADDIVPLSLLLDLILNHGHVLQQFVDWFDILCLELIVIKTKEMVVAFSNKQGDLL